VRTTVVNWQVPEVSRPSRISEVPLWVEACISNVSSIPYIAFHETGRGVIPLIRLGREPISKSPFTARNYPGHPFLHIYNDFNHENGVRRFCPMNTLVELRIAGMYTLNNVFSETSRIESNSSH